MKKIKPVFVFHDENPELTALAFQREFAIAIIRKVFGEECSPLTVETQNRNTCNFEEKAI